MSHNRHWQQDRRLCAICDAWYLPEDAGEHKHPEPQSGPLRESLIKSGLPYGAWLSTPDGKKWDDYRNGR